MIVGVSKIEIDKKGQGKITIPQPVYYTILSKSENTLELLG
jgi:hypothetical protein